MNILKFIKGHNSTNKKDVERNQQVLNDIALNIDSTQRVARVLHTKAYNTWTPAADKNLVEAFKKQLGRDTYSLLTPKQRHELLRRVANDVCRSPEAIVLRLRPTGLLKVKGNSKATLQAIAAQAST